MSLLDKLTGQKIVCPWWLCSAFDNPLRRFFHNPYAMLKPYVHPGDSVVDIGCGMGYFTIPLARLAGPKGHIAAIDIQEKMLAALRKRAERNNVTETITTHLGGSGSFRYHEKADFVLLFWMFHEVPDQRASLIEIRDILKRDGRMLFVEPIVHVPKKSFLQTVLIATDLGFYLIENPQIRFSRSALLGFAGDGPMKNLAPKPLR